MAMRSSTANVTFTHGKCCKVRGIYNDKATGVARSFVCEFVVETEGTSKAITEEALVKGLRENFFSLIAAIQSSDIIWIKVYVEPNVEATESCFYGFMEPVPGKIQSSVPKEEDYVLNLLIEKNNQSRNVVIPGVAEDLKVRDAHKQAIEALEMGLVSGFLITKDVKLNYTRINRKDEKENVVGALCTGFRKKVRRR